jgi:hypothetical protein
MKARLALFAFLQALVFGVLAQTPDDLNEGTQLEYDSENSIWRFKWWGRTGNTYFLQHSEDLQTWSWVPVVEPGDDSIKEWGITTTADKFFWRLKFWTGPTSDPEGDDFDGDGLTNLWEVQNGLNPLKADSDGDGMPDGWEVANGLDARADDAFLDPDDDGLANLAEHAGQYDPHEADTDGDGLMDGWGRGDFVFGASGWLEGAGAAAFVYDAAGNLTSAGGTP